MNFKQFLKEKKAQTSLEYLLILGGAVLIVAVVGYYLKTAGSAGAKAAQTHPTQSGSLNS